MMAKSIEKFTTADQFWNALSQKSQNLINEYLVDIVPPEIKKDPDYQEILKDYQDSYYAEDTLSESEPIIRWITRDYLLLLLNRLWTILTRYNRGWKHKPAFREFINRINQDYEEA